MAVGASEEGPRQNERPHVRSPLQVALHCGAMMVKAINVVKVSVLDPIAVCMALMEVVARHRHFWAIENARLVHVVPSIKVGPVVGIIIHGKELGPLVAHFWIAEVWVVRCARPTPAIVLTPAFRLRVKVKLTNLREHVVALVLFDVGVDDRHEFPLRLRKRVEQYIGLGKVRRVPSEVLLPIGVVNVEPKDIVGYIVLVEFLVDAHRIIDVHVIPARLVLADCRKRRETRHPGHSVVLLHHCLRRRPSE
mmetsp:Transcript_88082/g.247634  ORF Transcript_88082/g.247634 Transcript_88082/m.247634 type:complete len:250 (+) Transcript_88082:1135-1884(+)